MPRFVRPSFALVLALAALAAAGATPVAAQSVSPPPRVDARVYAIIDSVSAARIEKDVRALAGFGTRNTFSDTVSATRGIGAARRYVKAEFDRIARGCNGCLSVRYVSGMHGDSTRRVNVVDVIAVQKGTIHPDRYVVMSGDIDSRASNTFDGTTDAPGANDNASGMAGVLEAARVLTKYSFGSSIIYVGLSGEEQGLWGGQDLADTAKAQGWDIAAFLNNDMIGNIQGVNGVIDNTTFRVFSEPVPPATTEAEYRRHRFYGGEVDGPSRQLARYIDRVTSLYFTNLDAMMIYRLDRFGRGGHHRPFNDAGYPAVRIMETNENYTRQHQNLRTENGIAYGDVVSGVNFDYAARLTAVNATVLATLAWAPPSPQHVKIGGAVQPSTTLAWDPVVDPTVAGYRIYWRATTSPQWEHSRFVGTATRYTLENLVIDNYLFGVATVGKDGNESVVAFPSEVMR